jgi:hypothetical protein
MSEKEEANVPPIAPPMPELPDSSLRDTNEPNIENLQEANLLDALV